MKLLLAVAAMLIALALVAGYSGIFHGEASSAGDAAATGLLDQPAAPGDAGGAGAPAPAAREQLPVFETLAFPAQMPAPARIVRLPVLMFHHIGDVPAGADAIRQGLTVSGAEFDSMMAYLKQAGYHPVSQKQLFKALYMGEPLPDYPVMLTLDDGYSDNYSVAAPILEKYGFTATFYIISDNVGTPEFMTWEQIGELDRKGMDIGSHTCSHPELTSLPAAELSRELGDSEAALAGRLGHPVYWLCYPAGKFDDDVENAARSAGYLLAVTTRAGEEQSSDAPYELWRYRVRSDTGLEGFKDLVRPLG